MAGTARRRGPLGAVVCLVAPLGLVGLSACGGAPPAPAYNVALHYPDACFLVGEGTGPTRQEAEADARARVATQVTSSLSEDLKVRTSETNGQTDTSVDRVFKLKTDFQRAELIELVDKAARCDDRGCTAVAALSRGRYYEAMEKSYARARPTWQQAVEAAEKADVNDITAFTRHFRAATRAYGPLLSLARRSRVVVGQVPKGADGDETRMNAVISQRARLMGEIQVTVIPGEMSDPEVGAAVQQAMVSAVSALGLRARSGPACQEGLALVPMGQVSCKPGSLGTRCSLPLQGRLTDCATGAELTPLDFRALKLRGAHPKDVGKARADLLKRTAKAPMSGALRNQLSSILPLEETP